MVLSPVGLQDCPWSPQGPRAGNLGWYCPCLLFAVDLTRVFEVHVGSHWWTPLSMSLLLYWWPFVLFAL